MTNQVIPEAALIVAKVDLSKATYTPTPVTTVLVSAHALKRAAK